VCIAVYYQLLMLWVIVHFVSECVILSAHTSTLLQLTIPVISVFCLRSQICFVQLPSGWCLFHGLLVCLIIEELQVYSWWRCLGWFRVIIQMSAVCIKTQWNLRVIATCAFWSVLSRVFNWTTGTAQADIYSYFKRFSKKIAYKLVQFEMVWVIWNQLWLTLN